MIVNKVERIVMSGLVLQLLWLAAAAVLPMDQIQAVASAVEIFAFEMPVAVDDPQPETMSSGSSGGTSDGCLVSRNGLLPIAGENFSIRGSLTVDFADMSTVHFAHFIRPPPVSSS